MRDVSKLLLQSLIAASLFSPSLVWAARASSPATSAFDEPLDPELANSELAPEEQAPPPEYPYPGAREEGVTPPDLRSNLQSKLRSEPPVPTGIERPTQIDKETGDYHYDTKPTAPPPPVARGPQHTPEAVTETGEYRYSEDERVDPVLDRSLGERPISVLPSGEFKYATEHKALSGSASFRMGSFGPPSLMNTNTHKFFQDIYTPNQLPVLFLDYEWPLHTSLGHVGLKLGSGIFVAQGQGQFVKLDSSRRPDDLPPEKYTFLMFPNELTSQYRFQYRDTQKIIPYVEGGLGFFTFTEFRDDNSGPRFGGALTGVLAGGANFQMDWLDPGAIQRLEGDYGIQHVYFALEFRQIIGLNSAYDFSSSVINAGFMLQF